MILKTSSTCNPKYYVLQNILLRTGEAKTLRLPRKLRVTLLTGSKLVSKNELTVANLTIPLKLINMKWTSLSFIVPRRYVQL